MAVTFPDQWVAVKMMAFEEKKLITAVFLFQQHLQVAKGENRHALHRAQRWYDGTEKAWGYALVGHTGTFVLQMQW